MAQYLKRWESPRREGRNHKGRGGSARKRQVIKQQQIWRQRLRPSDPDSKSTTKSDSQQKSGGDSILSTFLLRASIQRIGDLG